MVIEVARKVAGMTQEEVASHLGISVPTYRKMEKDPACITIEDARTLAALFGIDVSQIFFATNDN
uniref:XRE family transcriptional regulator n=1 Tax=Muribaculaceae bacterium Z82 TaxID=2304548 RepID=A0A7C9JEU2_9BACT